MPKRKFTSESLLNYGPVIQVKIKSTKKNSNIDYINGIREKFITITAFIDTGATHSILDSTILKEDLGLEKTRLTDRVLLIYASAQTFPVYKVGFCLLGNNDCKDILIAVGDLSTFKVPKFDVKMLIGRDILSNCVFTYNGIDNIFSLDHKLT